MISKKDLAMESMDHRTVIRAFNHNRWPIYFMYGVKNGSCLCGRRNCGKKGRHLLKEESINSSGILAEPGGYEAALTKYRNCNIAASTGRPSRLLVVEVELTHRGTESLAVLQNEHGDFPRAMEATGGGRSYIFFHTREEVESVMDLRPGLHVHNGNSAVPIPPSRLCDGNMRWLEAHEPRTAGTPQAPSWLISVMGEEVRKRY